MSDTSSCAAVAAALRAYADELAAAGAVQVGGAFTDNAEADALIKSDPLAFLIGVLFTQGVPAERAWAGPWLLRQRLGHLDPARLATERASVDAAFCSRPALHRFKHTVAGWVSDMAGRLLSCWGGDPCRIWEQGSTVAEVSERLASFPGIGRKKAAMAVELLTRHFGVELAGTEDGTVAYDVHVRRVFLRTGLATRDTPEAVTAAARTACPAAPGSLDLASWLVGRQWCRPRDPRCEECRLAAACPRLTDASVEGVGVRGPRGVAARAGARG